MKKTFLLSILPLILITGCANEPEDELPPPEAAYHAKLTADNSTLTLDDSTAPIIVDIPSEEDPNIKYSFEIGNPCYINTKSAVALQICLKPGVSIKSKSNYYVDRLVVDFYGGKGINYEVYNNVNKTGEKVTYHSSSRTPTDPDDYGTVYEYSIQSTGWNIFNATDFNKPTFYYIEVFFAIS